MLTAACHRWIGPLASALATFALAAAAQAGGAAATVSTDAHEAHELVSAGALPHAARVEADDSGWGWLPYAVGGLGIAAVGTSLLLVQWSDADDDLLEGCSPRCRPTSVEHVRSLHVVADVSLAVGVAAVGTATWLLLADVAAEQPPAAYSIDVRPTRAGAFATVTGEF